MARYEDYTEKQQIILTDLYRKASQLKRKIDAIKKKRRDNFNMSYEENSTSLVSLRNLEKEYKDLSEEITNILNARVEYEGLCKKAKLYLDRAQSIKDTWGF